MKIIVLGAGAWGTALAVSASRHALAHHAVTLWVRDAAQALALQQGRENKRYLPGVALPTRLEISDQSLPELVMGLRANDLVIVASPMAGLRGFLVQLAGSQAAVAWLC